MKQTGTKLRQTLALCSLISAYTAHAADSTSLQWPSGRNICTGAWSYFEVQECEHPDHGQDTSRPINETNGSRCGYEQKTASCWYGFNTLRTIETGIHSFDRDHDEYQADELREFCHSQIPAQSLNEREVISAWDFEKVDGHGECIGTKWFRCDKWKIFVDIKCHYTVSGPIFGQHESCGQIDDTSRPRTCAVGYHYNLKRSAQCPSLRRETTRGFDRSSLAGDPALTDFSCSTADHLPAERPEHAQAKLAFITQKLWSLPSSGHPDWPVLIQALKTLVSARSDMLSEKERSLANQLVDSSSRSVHNMNISNFGSGNQDPIFSTAKDCIELYSENIFRGCRNKLINLKIGQIDALRKLGTYANLSLKISYDNGCKVNTDDLKVRLITDATNQLLAPTDSGSVQWTQLVFNPSSQDPTITIDVNPAAKISSSCTIAVEHAEVILDVKLLEQYTDLLLSKLELINMAKSQLFVPSVGASVSDIVQKLDSQFSTVMTRHQFDCNEQAKAAGITVPAICQVSDDYSSICALNTVAVSGIPTSLIEKIHDDACMLSDLRSIRTEERCSIYSDLRPGSLCRSQLQTFANFLDQEYAIAIDQARDLATALAIEGNRITAMNSELSMRLKFLLDRVGTKLRDLETSR